MTIGERAAKAIRERARMKGIKKSEELELIGANRKNYGDWALRNLNPSAYWLQQLALAGYDIHWILTGEKKYTEQDIDFDIAELEDEI